MASKSKEPSNRNPYALHAKKRRAGKMRSKKDKRKSGKNEEREVLKEVE